MIFHLAAFLSSRETRLKLSNLLAGPVKNFFASLINQQKEDSGRELRRVIGVYLVFPFKFSMLS